MYNLKYLVKALFCFCTIPSCGISKVTKWMNVTYTEIKYIQDLCTFKSVFSPDSINFIIIIMINVYGLSENSNE